MSNKLGDLERRKPRFGYLTGMVATVSAFIGVVSVVIVIQTVADPAERLIVTTGTVVEHGNDRTTDEYTDVAAEGEDGRPMTVRLEGAVGAVGEEVTFTYDAKHPAGIGTHGVRESEDPPLMQIVGLLSFVGLGGLGCTAAVVLFWRIVIEGKEERLLQS